MQIIGVTGTIGAGKGTIVEYLMKYHDFTHFSVRSYLTGKLVKEGLEVNRDNMVGLANELRAANTPSYIIEELYNLAAKEGKNCVIESIRTIGEVDALRNKDHFYFLAIDANPKVRYERIIERKSETDFISFDEFLANEMREMSSEDANKQNITACIQMADYTLLNNDSFVELREKLDMILADINQQEKKEHD